jgi:hypothetical protein
MAETLEAPSQEQAPTQESQAPDPYALDEQTLSGLAPEARVAFDGAVKTWRTKAEEQAKAAAQKAAEETASKYKDYDEQKKYGDALRQMAADPRFQQVYQAVYGNQQQQQPQLAAPAEEYALAVQEAAAGNPARLNQIFMRTVQQVAAPTLREFTQLKQERAQDQQIDSLFRAHPDAEELDDVGLFGEGTPTPLELAIHRVVDQQGGTFEQAYTVARQIAQAYEKKYKNAALGMVNGKKESVTESASRQTKDSNTVIEVASGEEALRKNIEAEMKGQKVTYVAKQRTFRR